MKWEVNEKVLGYVSCYDDVFLKDLALAGVVDGLSASLQTKRSKVWFPVRAHAWVAG